MENELVIMSIFFSLLLCFRVRDVCSFGREANHSLFKDIDTSGLFAKKVETSYCKPRHIRFRLKYRCEQLAAPPPST